MFAGTLDLHIRCSCYMIIRQVSNHSESKWLLSISVCKYMLLHVIKRWNDVFPWIRVSMSVHVHSCIETGNCINK